MPRKVVKAHTKKDGTKVRQYTQSGKTKKNAGKEFEAMQNKFDTPKSSNIANVSHNPHTNTLYVGFKSGSTYAYKNVPAEVFNSFKKASKSGSAGKWHNENIKHKYEYSKFK